MSLSGHEVDTILLNRHNVTKYTRNIHNLYMNVCSVCLSATAVLRSQQNNLGK